jgi:gas vesicle protein
LAGALIGGAIGAITALVFAPKSGRELRRDIADRSAELYDKA